MRVETFGSPATLDESLAQIDRLAKLTDRPAKGRALQSRIMRAVPILDPRALGSRAIGEDTEFDALLWQPGQIVAGEDPIGRHARCAL